jgi:hypothetical protein
MAPITEGQDGKQCSEGAQQLGLIASRAAVGFRDREHELLVRVPMG